MFVSNVFLLISLFPKYIGIKLSCFLKPSFPSFYQTCQFSNEPAISNLMSDELNAWRQKTFRKRSLPNHRAIDKSGDTTTLSFIARYRESVFPKVFVIVVHERIPLNSFFTLSKFHRRINHDSFNTFQPPTF